MTDTTTGATTDTMTRRVWLGLGGNVGDVRTALSGALSDLGSHSEIELSGVSGLYRTPPWGLEDQPWFLNCCAEIATSLSPRDLLLFCHSLERLGKRERVVRWGPRTLDIDILIYEGEEISDSDLTLPHPRMLERSFVLVPLRDLAPDLLVSGEKVSVWTDRISSDGIELVSSGDWHL